jgi:GR25 family glycosyltransferase involved in LPS biosynthesis
MMRAIKIAACIAIGISNPCHASTDSECLKHLGGAFGDVECFNGLSNDLKQENSKLAKSIASTIPDRNKNKALLNAYLQNQVTSQKFCELSRESMTDWMREAVTVNPRYHDYDVAYYECVYGLLAQENKFLKILLKNTDQK